MDLSQAARCSQVVCLKPMLLEVERSTLYFVVALKNGRFCSLACGWALITSFLSWSFVGEITNCLGSAGGATPKQMFSLPACHC